MMKKLALVETFVNQTENTDRASTFESIVYKLKLNFDKYYDKPIYLQKLDLITDASINFILYYFGITLSDKNNAISTIKYLAGFELM